MRKPVSKKVVHNLPHYETRDDGKTLALP